MHAAFNSVFDIDGATVVNNGARIDYTNSSSESVEPKSAINNGDLNLNFRSCIPPRPIPAA